jgi:Fe(3+) dicitrate transport protein
MKPVARAGCAALLVLGQASAGALARAQDPPEEEATAGARATADEGGAAGDEDDAPPEAAVEVIGEKADAMQRIPGSATVVRPDEIERADPLNASEMLRRVPGLNVREDNGGGGRLDIGVRGLDPGRSRRVLLLEDGVPIANNPYAEPDLYFNPPIERWQGFEVLRGSGSVLFGPQTIGGVINFITPFAPSRREVRLEVKGGQRAFFSAFGRYGDGFGSARYLAQLLYRRGQGFRDQGFSTLNALGKVTFDTSVEGTVTVKLGLHHDDSDSDDIGLTSAMFAAKPDRLTLAPHDHATTNRYDSALMHEHRFDDHVTLRTLAYGYYLERVWVRQDYHRFPIAGARYERIVGDVGVPGGAIYFLGSSTILDRSYGTFGLEPRLELRFATGEVGHTVSVGARALGETAHYEQRAGERNDSSAGELTLDESRYGLGVAAYVQDRIGFLGDALLVTPGVRVEHARYYRQLDREPSGDGGVDVDESGEEDSTALIPGIGMTAGTPEMHGFAGVHVGYAPPRATSSVRALGQTTVLEGERSIAYELGTRLGGGKLWQIEATGFLTNFENQIIPGTGDAFTELVNAGSTRHYGLEAGAGVGFGEIIGAGVRLDVLGRYTLSRAEFAGGEHEGNRLPYAPSHIASATLDVGHAVGVGGELSYTFVGDQFADDAATEPEDITGRIGLIPAYHQLDANLRYTNPHTGLTATVSVKNLLDEPFIIARRPEGIHASGFRQIIFGLRWDYAEDAPP